MMARPSTCPTATAVTHAGVAGEGFADRAAGGRIPHPHGPVVGAGDDDSAAVGLPDRHRAHPRRCGR